MLKYFIFIVLLTTEINSLQNDITDYCFSNDTECKGDYSLNGVYTIKCQKVCKGKYDYKCSDHICAINKESCDTHNKQLQINGSITKIKNCPVNTQKISIYDFCINAIDCYETKLKLLRNGFFLKKKFKVCECKGDLTYECVKGVCTKNDKACNLLNKNKVNDLKNQLKKAGIKNCEKLTRF
jgi:hypothetical protein